MNFTDLHLIPPILKALAKEGYTAPTPIQGQAIPAVLAGKDVFGCAQTGTGKTAAFTLPMLQRLQAAPPPSGRRAIRALILSPTRELALQIADSVQAYGQFLQLRSAAIVGGVSQRPQEQQIERGVDILIATPGRLIDLLNQKVVDLRHVQILVLDEADRMLDMGFINDVKKIIAAVPTKRQTLFFSATVPPEISKLATSLLVDPVKVEITPVSSTVERIEQSVYFVDKDNKQKLLNELLLKDRSIVSAIVFTRTKHGADRVAKGLMKANIPAQAIHGDKSQNARQSALNNFKAGATRVLVATDIAARGIDIEELSHVINFNLPNIPETYVHRIGRTGRAGLSGTAISFCEAEEIPYLKDIEKLIKKSIPVVKEHPYPMIGTTTPASPAAKPTGARPSGRPAGGARSNAGKPASHAARASGAKPQGRPEAVASVRGGGNVAARPAAGKPGTSRGFGGGMQRPTSRGR
ncbi:DEAD/DEAH box helicase [Paenibacillus sp.]|uniref:DEAD/DEAH box helicase n=1 Tax=Paenibacillus sp. TaxID=58172 RepID=UPI002D2ADCDC|nr:DEAD/DEAH box helicase [Paenibacillus sp.]HZG58395.1 DEAD/DEAH box helicase [Paenibacillus sp.]